MAEYDLVCDACGAPVAPPEGVVAWTTSGTTERGHALVHTACALADATDRRELRLLVGPNSFLRFVTERFGYEVADAGALSAIVCALAPFVMRSDAGPEMEAMRAATFGARPGVKPDMRSREERERAAAEAREPQAGK